jgi:galactokinase/mevalonate kinase-like predicted kinase
MIVYASAPTSLLEIGAWTDNPAAEYGATWSFAAQHFAHVTLATRSRAGLVLQAPVGISPELDTFFRAAAHHFGLEGYTAHVTTDAPVDTGIDMTVASHLALSGALAWAARRFLTPHQLAGIAHDISAQTLRHASGIQPYMTSALGGMLLLNIAPYPRAFPSPVTLAPAVVSALEARLLLVCTGRVGKWIDYPVASQRVHAQDPSIHDALWQLRALPRQVVEALQDENFSAFAQALAQHERLQRRLTPSLVSPEARFIEAMARRHAAQAVMTHRSGRYLVLCGPPEALATLAEQLRLAEYAVHPVKLDPYGLRVWAQEADRQWAQRPPVRQQRQAA